MPNFLKLMGKQRSKSLYNQGGFENSPSKNRGDLSARTVYLYFHLGFDVENSNKLYQLEVNMEKKPPFDQNQGKEGYGDSIFQIDQMFEFEYQKGLNEVQICLYDQSDDDIYGMTSLKLYNYKPNKMYQVWIDIQNEESPEKDIELMATLFMDRDDQEEEEANRSIFVNFMRQEQQSFMQRCKAYMLKEVNKQKRVLGQIIHNEMQVETILNERYNMVPLISNASTDKKQSARNKQLGLKKEEFKDLVEEMFYSTWLDKCDLIYTEFVTSTSQKLYNDNNPTNQVEKLAVSLNSKLTESKIQSLDGLGKEQQSFFNQQNFIVGVLLYSSLTLNQKLELLYNLFDWDSGERDGIDSFSIESMLKTILNRSMMAIPANQLENVIELVFDGEPSFIVKATLSKRSNIVRAPKMQDGDDDSDSEEENDDVDVTDHMQELLWRYHSLYGSKQINFNLNYFTPFKQMDDLFEFTTTPPEKPVGDDDCPYYKLLLIYMTNGIKRVREISYNASRQVLVNHKPRAAEG